MLRSHGKLKLDNTSSDGIDVVPYPLNEVLCIEGTEDFHCALDVGSLRQEVKGWSELWWDPSSQSTNAIGCRRRLGCSKRLETAITKVYTTCNKGD